jgi:hypothetical protein
MKIYLKIFAFLFLLFLAGVYRGVRFAGDGTRGTSAPGLDVLEGRLRASVTHLAETIGERNAFQTEALDRAADWIQGEWKAQGLTIVEQRYSIGERGPFRNLEVDVAGPAGAPILLIGAHYDSVSGSPGADDNASGVAVLMEVTRALKGAPLSRRLRCVAFTNEEPPWFCSENMGSRRYAKMARARGDEIEAMVSLETLGWYSDEPGSQQYPPGFGFFYPAEGNFVGVVTRIRDRPLVVRALERLRPATGLPVRAAAVWATIPGVYWSDHWSFWEEGYPAMMITDTAYFRNPHYHAFTDVPVNVDFPRLADITAGIIQMVQGLCGKNVE